MWRAALGLRACRGHPARVWPGHLALDPKAGCPRHLGHAATCNCPAGQPLRQPGPARGKLALFRTFDSAPSLPAPIPGRPGPNWLRFLTSHLKRHTSNSSPIGFVSTTVNRPLTTDHCLLASFCTITTRQGLPAPPAPISGRPGQIGFVLRNRHRTGMVE